MMRGKVMESKTQIFTNILLSLCFAFVVYIYVETDKRIKSIQGMIELIELRDKMYVEARMKTLEDLQKEIVRVKNIKLEIKEVE